MRRCQSGGFGALTSLTLSTILCSSWHIFSLFKLCFYAEVEAMNRLSRYPLILCWALILLWVNPGPFEKAWGDEYPSSTTSSHQKEQSSGNPGIWFIDIYRDYISPVDGDRCPSVPSCSSYALQAFKKHGFFIGWMMTVDRLIHEGQEERSVSPLIYSNGTWKFYDPVENNDFWWFHRDRKQHE
jgi:hypothetical protein